MQLAATTASYGSGCRNRRRRAQRLLSCPATTAHRPLPPVPLALPTAASAARAWPPLHLALVNRRLPARSRLLLMSFPTPADVRSLHRPSPTADACTRTHPLSAIVARLRARSPPPHPHRALATSHVRLAARARACSCPTAPGPTLTPPTYELRWFPGPLLTPPQTSPCPFGTSRGCGGAPASRGSQSCPGSMLVGGFR